MKKIRLATLLWVCYSLFIVYATTIPFNAITSQAELNHNMSVISWKPFYNTDAHGYFSRGNLITNVLFFMPFGFFGFYALQSKKRPKESQVIFLSILGTCLSAFVEFLQMFTVDRNTSDTDLITNTLGTIVGLACAGMIKPSFIRSMYNRGLARFANTETAFPLAGLLFVILAGALAPFDFAISRDALFERAQHLLPLNQAYEFNKKEFVVFLYYGALLSFAAALGFKQWRIKKFKTATIIFVLSITLICEVLQLFIPTRNPTGGGFLGIVAGLFAGLLIELFVSRHYRLAIAWLLIASMALLLLFFNFSSPMQSTSKLGSFLRFSSHGSKSLIGLMNFIEITAQFIPIGFILAYLCSRGKKRRIFIASGCFLPVLAAPLLFLHGLPSLYDIAVLIIAQIAVFIGAAACLWAWPVFNYYCRYYADT